MNNRYIPDRSDMQNNYTNANYSQNYGQYNYANYGYGAYGASSEEGGGPQRNFKDYLFLIRERIWYLLIVFFIIFLGSILYTFNKTKEYTAFSQVELLRDDPTVMASTSNLDLNEIYTPEDLNTHIGKLESAAIIKGVEQRLQEEELIKFMAPYKGVFSFSGPLTAFEILAKNRKIVPQRLSLMVKIVYTHPSPIIAAKIANLFADEYINLMLTQNIDASMKAVEDLRIRADQKKDRVEELELKLAEYRELKNAVSLDDQENIAVTELANLNSINTTAKIELDRVETKWKLIQEYKKSDKNLLELSFISNDGMVERLRAEISSIRINIAAQGKRYREKHPTMKSLLEQLQESEKELKYAINEMVDLVYATLVEAKDNYELSSKRLVEKEKDMIYLSKTRVEFNSLLRDLEVEEMTYGKLIALMAEEKIQVNIKNANARIIDKAFPPREDRPSSPNYFLNIFGGFFGGIFAGLALVFCVAFIDDKVKSVFDIEGSIGIPMIGVIPRIKKLDSASKSHIVNSSKERHVTENFRAILSYLKINDQSKNCNVFLVTSTVPGEGKSFICSNLSLSYAAHTEKVLLIDGDLRLPNVAKTLQLENELGILDYIKQNDDKSIDEYIIKDVYTNLDVLPSGGKSKKPTAVLSDNRFESMILELRDKYDKIIIDSPPLAAVSDALNIVPLVDSVLFIIKYDTVKKGLAQTCLRRLWESKTPVMGAILNDVSIGLATYYYSQYANKKYAAYYMHEELEDSAETQEVAYEEVRSNYDNKDNYLADVEIEDSDDLKEVKNNNNLIIKFLSLIPGLRKKIIEPEPTKDTQEDDQDGSLN